jgi:hypothetical protein
MSLLVLRGVFIPTRARGLDTPDVQSAIRIAAPGPKRHAIALDAVSSRFVQTVWVREIRRRGWRIEVRRLAALLGRICPSRARGDENPGLQMPCALSTTETPTPEAGWKADPGLLRGWSGFQGAGPPPPRAPRAWRLNFA